MYPMLSCAGVGLYPKIFSGIESKAWARRPWNVSVRCFMTAVIGFAGGGCWAARVMGKATQASAARETLMRSLPGRNGDDQLTLAGDSPPDPCSPIDILYEQPHVPIELL